MRLRYQLLVVAVVSGVALSGGCSDEPAGGRTGDGGDTCLADCGPDLGADMAVDLGRPDVGDGGEAPDGGGDTADGASCDGAAVNGCGGCAVLEAVPETPCGPCGFGVWTCDGADAVSCVGDPGEQDWYPDGDGDGFGDPDGEPVHACLPPDAGWASNADDCDDERANANVRGDEVCNGLDDDCDEAVDEAPDGHPECADACCSDTLVCDEGACLIPCGTVRCGAALDLCCEADEICFANTCAVPGASCEFTEDCGPDELCEPELGICLPREIVPECVFVPPVGEFEPRVGCRWTSAGLPQAARNDVVGAPIVVNLTDDNGDGATDEDDIPDVAFLTYDLEGDSCCNVGATLRVVSGRCNEDGGPNTPATMQTLASLSAPVMTNDTGIAAGDLDGDGVPELLAVGFWGRSGDDRPQGVVAFRRTADDGTAWEVAWTNEEYPTWNVHTRGGAAIAVADLNHDGNPEVIVGNVVLNGQTGALLWDGNESSEDPVGIGNNAFLGPVSAVADVDNDTFLEVIAGNTLYSWDGEVRWTFEYTTSNSACGGSLACDGFDGVGNFDDDPEAEIVIVRLGEVFILEHTGELLWRQPIPVDDCGNNEAGPPTVADFDGDGRPEIGTAGADFYVVVDRDCDPEEGPVPEECLSRGVLWAVPNTDCSSRATASSVFDFEGDGAAEVIYADERNFRIFDGATGTLLFDDATHGSHTRIEMPVIADVDNDGNAEVVIPENASNGGTPGVEIWEDRSDNWVRTRRIWNQHSYHITNIEEDGSVPQFEAPNWRDPRYNNFRQNVQPDGLFDAPDLVVPEVSADSYDCLFEVTVVVGNDGALSVPEGLPVRVELLQEGEVVASETAETTTRLSPRDRETLTVTILPPEGATSFDFTVRVTVDADAEVNECDDTNNSASTEVTLSCAPKD